MRRLAMRSLLSFLIAGCAQDRVYDEKLIARFEARVFEDDKYGYALPYRLFVPDG